MADKREIKNIACVGEVMIELIVGVDGEASSSPAIPSIPPYTW